MRFSAELLGDGDHARAGDVPGRACCLRFCCRGERVGFLGGKAERALSEQPGCLREGACGIVGRGRNLCPVPGRGEVGDRQHLEGSPVSSINSGMTRFAYHAV